MRRKAFTLIELILTISILGIIVSVATLTLSAFNQNEINILISDLNYGRTYAVQNQKTVFVDFDILDNNYTIFTNDIEIVHRKLKDIDFEEPFHIDKIVKIYPSGAFSKCGHIPFKYKGEYKKLNFTVGIAHFTLGDIN